MSFEHKVNIYVILTLITGCSSAVPLHPQLSTGLCGFPLYTSECLCVGLSDGRRGFKVGDLSCVRSKLWYFQSESQFHGKTTARTPRSPITNTHTRTHAEVAVTKGQHMWEAHTDLVCLLYRPVVAKIRGTVYLSVQTAGGFCSWVQRWGLVIQII